MTLIRKLKENRDSDIYPFHMPGHKRRLAGDDILKQIYGIDITEIPGFDDLHDANGIILEAEKRTAALFGADETHFLVNGSTCGILSAIVGTVTKGDTVIAGSNCHRSVFNGIMLSGAQQILITPGTQPQFGIYSGISVEAVTDALEKACGNRVAVVITSPTYEGITSDVEAIAQTCHEHNAVLIVDSAHGAHFGFSEGFPKSAVTTSADAVITSVHKTLPAMTQTSLIHINKNCPSRDGIVKMLSVFQTSSPSYILMASIDSMTDLLERRGEELFSAYEKRLDDFYKAAGKLCSLSILTKDRVNVCGSADHDRGRIVIGDRTGTYPGEKLSEILLERYGLCAEKSGDKYVLLITSVADTDEGFERLTNALIEIDNELTAGK